MDLDRLGVQRLLDAMDGVCYLADRNGIVLAVGRRGWMRAAEPDGPAWLPPDAVLGRSLFEQLLGEAVQTAYRRMHGAVASGKRASIMFQYRCDAPDSERHMRLSITGVAGHVHGQGPGQDGVALVLYQSQLLNALPRPPMHLFSSDLLVAPGHRPQALPLVALCSICHMVAWPAAGGAGGRTWLAPQDFYRRDAPGDFMVTHDLCPACQDGVVRPNC